MINFVLVTYFLLTLGFSKTASLTQIPENNFYALDLVCIGTNGGISVPSNRDHHYRNLRDRYTNCTYVDGNLELTWLQDEKLDLSFLQYIREVTGYVLISHVDVRRVVLPNLQIIRGRTLYKLPVSDDSFGLLVMLSKMSTLELPSLRDILHGSVGLFNNYNLCHVRSINWTEAMSDINAKYTYAYNFSQPQRTCHCDESCERGCWGEGPENCQKFSKITCSPQCHDGRCYGPGPRDCCHLFCAGGCSGPTQSDCLACRNFNDNGTCKQECPPMNVYNTITYSWERNPLGKYAYGATCVRECPGHLLKDNGACVRSCPPGKKGVDGECVPCEGPCPKTCKGVENVHSGNIDSFKDCTIIEGSLVILDHSFAGFQVVHENFTFGEKFPEMHPSKLEVFSTLKEITGYISIQASHPEFTNLNFLRNLEIVGGRSTTEYFSSVYIVKTLLRSLNFQSLRLIRAGSVYILENRYLCFVETINWNKLIDNHTKSQVLLENNRDKEQCEYEGMSCHKECNKDGCWGIGEDQCMICKNKKLGTVCINSCNSPGIYKKNATECAYCHSECKGGCSGPESKDCNKCKNVRDGPFCVEKCPETKYSDGKLCKLCNENCVGGCRGPENNVGSNGCNSCEKALINREKGVEYCLKSDEACPLEYFSDFVVKEEAGILKQMAGKNVCLRCDPRCQNCTGYGIHNTVCHQCSSYRLGENCVDQCPSDHYIDIENECLRCSIECSQGCYGPTESKCYSCRNYRIYTEGSPANNNTNFYCTAACPDEFPYKIFPEDLSDPFCAASPNVLARIEDATIIGSVLGCLFVLCIIILLWGYCLWTKNKKKKAALKMTMSMIPYDDNEPLKPTNIRPNLAQLRIVKEAELRKGGILGYGAFGTVHKGVWIPEGENVKIPVAIKVLREGTETNINNKILEEAYIMASVDHPNLLRLLAVCMTTQTMMVTQLMPLGCLLDYVRNNKEKIGSKALLNWCTQIAKGMLYLEERRLVHRDLAARNVLVQTPNSVKITDFGLAKLLDFNEDEYKADGGKMPIKWLALECIQHRIFTHKSDVWAFGVTVWEILTYGGRPYDDFPAREVPERLEKGERLPQPPTCTIDIYMLMIKCWMLDYNSRPSFKELAEEFAKMSRDPGRFLVIPGDKLMRLPSYTPQDEKEMIRSLSSGFDGEGILMAAEEYLHPKNQPGTQLSHSEPTTPIKTALQFNSAFSSSDCASENSGSPQNRMNSQREKKFSQFDGAIPQPGIAHDPRNARYMGGSMNPVGDSDVGDDDCFESDGPRNHPPNYMQGSNSAGYGCWVGNVRLDLPLDEDDYLMPSQQPGPPTVGPSHQHYMELMSDDAKQMRSGGYPVPNGSKGPRSYSEHSENVNGHNSKRPQNHKKHPPPPPNCFIYGQNDNRASTNGRWTSMDNPEYMFNGSHRMHHPHRPSFSDDQNNIGVPVVQSNRSGRHSTSSSGSHGNYGGSNPRGYVDDRNRPRISDSSHEYYNEVTNGENHSQQPRSETTV